MILFCTLLLVILSNCEPMKAKKKNTHMWLCDYPNYPCLNTRLEISSSGTCSTFQNRCHSYTSRFSRYGESDQFAFSFSIFSLHLLLETVHFLSQVYYLHFSFSAVVPLFSRSALFYLKINKTINTAYSLDAALIKRFFNK